MKYKKKIIPQGDGRIIFLSDLHYGHAGVLKHCPNRSSQFSNVSEMNSWIRENVFGKFRENDYIFDLGDTFWRKDLSEIIDILESSPGKKFKLVGNHDSENLYYGDNNSLKKYYETISDILDIQIPWNNQNYHITLSHYPILSWNHKFYGSIMLHGHSHGGLDEYNKNSGELRVDVGLDGTLANKILKKPWVEWEDIINFFNLH